MTSTYYDSQSGQYVPMHDKIKVTAYLRWRVNGIDDIGDYSNTPWSSLVGDHARALGAAGAIVTPLQQFLDAAVESSE